MDVLAAQLQGEVTDFEHDLFVGILEQHAAKDAAVYRRDLLAGFDRNEAAFLVEAVALGHAFTNELPALVIIHADDLL